MITARYVPSLCFWITEDFCEYEAGMLARSKAGHDKAQMNIIKEVDDTYVYLVDGRIRTLGHPKKKKKKHVQIVHGIYNMKELDDAGIRKLIKDWMKEEK